MEVRMSIAVSQSDPVDSSTTVNESARKRFTHQDALRVCRKAARTLTEKKLKRPTDLESLYVFVAAYAPELPPQVILGRRYYVPKPSPKARASILATVAKLASEDAKKELPTEYGISLKRIIEALKGSYTNSTLRNYVRQLATDGDLIRVAEGIYRPRQRINTAARINSRA
jgi:hypothetical protein